MNSGVHMTAVPTLEYTDVQGEHTATALHLLLPLNSGHNFLTTVHIAFPYLDLLFFPRGEHKLCHAWLQSDDLRGLFNSFMANGCTYNASLMTAVTSADHERGTKWPFWTLLGAAHTVRRLKLCGWIKSKCTRGLRCRPLNYLLHGVIIFYGTHVVRIIFKACLALLKIHMKTLMPMQIKNTAGSLL